MVALAGTVLGLNLAINAGTGRQLLIAILLVLLSQLLFIRRIETGVVVHDDVLQIPRMIRKLEIPIEQIVDVRIGRVVFFRPIYEIQIVTTDCKIVPLISVSWARIADSFLPSPQPIPTLYQLSALNAVRAAVGLGEVAAGSQDQSV